MSVQYGGAVKRLAAFGWDYLLIAGYIVLLALVSSIVWLGLLGRAPGAAEGQPWLYDLLSFATLVLPVILYFALQEASPAQATWGKRRAGLRVVSSSGGRLSTGRSLLRSGVKFLPWQIAHTCLFHIPGWPAAPEDPPAWVTGGFMLVFVLAGIYLAGLVMSREHRTAYDWIAGSHVVLDVSSAGPTSPSRVSPRPD